MQQTNSLQEICSILQRIEKTGQETAAFLHLYRFTDRPDIISLDVDPIQISVSIDLNAEAAAKALCKIAREQQEKRNPEIAIEAVALLYRLDELKQIISS